MTENIKVGRKRILIYFVGILGIFAIVTILPLVFGENVDTVLPREWKYEKVQWGQGIIIRDEKVYKTDFLGETYPIVKEGDRVRVGVEVAEVASLNDTTSLKTELDNIENWIAFLENASSPNVANTQSNMEVILSSIQNEILSGNIGEVYSLKNSLILLNTPDMDEISDNNYSTSNLEDLKIRRTQLINSLSKFSSKLYSNHSGIVSYLLDGSEEVLSVSGLEDLDPSMFKLDNEVDDRSVFKIIDSSDWYVGVLVDIDNMEYVLGRSYQIRLMGNDEEIITIRIPIVNDILFDNKRILVFKSTNYIAEVYNKRNVDAGILISEDDAFGVPNSSIFERDGVSGVYVKEFYGVVKFRRVDVLGVEGDTTYVSKGNNDGYLVTDDGERIRTLNIHDEVIKDPSKVYEGQILQ